MRGFQPLTSRLELPECPGWGSNPHVPFGTQDFKSRASAYSATRADTTKPNVWTGLPQDESLRGFERKSSGTSTGVKRTGE